MVHTERDPEDRKERPYPGQGQWRKATDYEDEHRLQRQVYALVVSDRRTRQEVASSLQISLADVDSLVEKERSTRIVEAQRPKDSEEDVAARKTQIQQQLYNHRTNVAGKRSREKLIENMRRASDLKGYVSDLAQRDKRLNMATIMGDRALQGALAMLEHDGEIVVGEIQVDGTVSVRWVPPRERAAIVKARRARAQAEHQAGRRPPSQKIPEQDA